MTGTARDADASVQVMRMMRGFMLSQALHVASKLAVFDALRDGPLPVDRIAAACSAEPKALHRLLRFLTAVDVLVEDDQGRFKATALGDALRSDHPFSARPLALMYGAPLFWRPWGDLFETVKFGVTAFVRSHDHSFFEHLALDSADAALFNAGMTSASRLDLRHVLEAYDFSGFRRIVDVGGGQGTLLQGILERYSAARGVLCDLPSVVANVARSMVSDRCELVGQDIFVSVPAHGDAYLLKRVLHDWNDDDALRLLKNVRWAIASGGKLLVIESVVLPSNQPDPAKWMDLNMLALFPGRERTADEFDGLFRSAGFQLTRIVPTAGVSIVEGEPV
jgi:SAM-dependent methyltransferase